MYTRVANFAKQTGYARETVYYWIRNGLIPESCILRSGGAISVNHDECMRLLRTGALARPKRKLATALGQAEDSHTTKGGANGSFPPRCQHRFVTDEYGTVDEDSHPYSPKMRRLR